MLGKWEATTLYVGLWAVLVKTTHLFAGKKPSPTIQHRVAPGHLKIARLMILDFEPLVSAGIIVMASPTASWHQEIHIMKTI